MKEKTRESRTRPTGVSIDIGDGRGSLPQYHIPQLGHFKTQWFVHWTSDDGVNVEVKVTVPGIGVMTHYARVPFDVQHQPGPVDLLVTRTTIEWEDFRIGMSQLRLADQIRQITDELQSTEMQGWLPFLPPAGLATKRTGRKGKRPIVYAELARRYVELVDGGDRHPNITLATEEGVGRKQIENVVSRCRDKGFLTSAPRGKAGGELTDYCLSVLEEHKR